MKKHLPEPNTDVLTPGLASARGRGMKVVFKNPAPGSQPCPLQVSLGMTPQHLSDSRPPQATHQTSRTSWNNSLAEGNPREILSGSEALLVIK